MSEPDQRQERGGLRSDQFSGLLLIAIAAYVGWENRAYPLGTLQEPGPGYVPLLLAIFLGVMGLLIALSGAKSPLLSSMKWPEATRAVLILVACAAATFALERIGYRLTMLAFLVFFLGAVERLRPLPVALVSFGFSVASFYVIGDLLHVPLPVSPWGF
jgi:hypothetical protein